MMTFKKKNEEISGSQHLISDKEVEEADSNVKGSQHFKSGSKVKYAYFKCDRYKPECSGARYYEFKRKADGLQVNT